MPPYIIPHDESRLKVIFKDIDLTQKQLDKDVITLREWLEAQPHLPQDALDDAMLAAFITGCKNSLQRAKQSIDRYLTNRTTFRDIYSDRDPMNEGMLHSETVFRYFPLPGATPEGFRVVLASLVNPDPDEFSFMELIKRMLSAGDVTLHIEKYHAGVYYVYDMQGLSLKHVTKITPSLCKKFLYCGEKSMPLRTKGSILFNSPSITEVLLNVIKPLMSQKTAKRIYVSSGDYTFIHKFLPKEILPYEYGGQAGPLEDLNRAWLEFAKGYREWFIADGKRHVDESKRPEKAVYKPSEMFGVEGSFKTLSID